MAKSFEELAQEIDAEARQEVVGTLQYALTSSDMEDGGHPKHDEFLRAVALVNVLMEVE